MKRILLGMFLVTITVVVVFAGSVNYHPVASPQIEIPLPDPQSPKCPSLKPVSFGQAGEAMG